MDAGKGLARCKTGQGRGQSGTEKQELEEKPWATEASRRWGGGKGGGTGIVPFGIKPLGYL